MEALLLQPAWERHIPGVARQQRHDTGGGEHHQGRHGPPGGMAPQPVIPTTARSQPQAVVIHCQGRHQEQTQLLGRQAPLPQRGRDAGAIKSQGIARLPGQIEQAIATNGWQGEVMAPARGQVLGQGPQVGFMAHGPVEAQPQGGRCEGGHDSGGGGGQGSGGSGHGLAALLTEVPPQGDFGVRRGRVGGWATGCGLAGALRWSGAGVVL